MAKDKKVKEEVELEAVEKEAQQPTPTAAKDLVSPATEEKSEGKVHECLSEEEKDALRHLIHWATEIGKRSTNVDWRRKTKDAISKLSRHL